MRRSSALLLVWCVALATFLPTLWSGFFYDDGATILTNAFIKRWSNLARFFTPEYFASVIDNNRPVMIVSTMIDYAIWGLKAAGYHLHNIILHAGVSVLVFLAAERVLKRAGVALLAATLFAVHPIHTEVVASINYREDLLATGFALGTFLLVDAGLLVAAIPLFVLGIFSKESVIALPFALILGDVARRPTPQALKAAWRPLVLAAIAAALFIPFAAAFSAYTSKASSATPFDVRALTAGRVFVAYLAQLVLPWSVSAEYVVDLTGARDGRNIAAALTLVAAAAVLVVLRARRGPRPWMWGVAWYAVLLLPSSNLVPIFNPRADRYLYLPSVGFCIAAAAGLAHLARRLDDRKALRAAGALCALLMMVTLFQVRHWIDELALWSHTVEQEPRSARAWSALAFSNLTKHRYDDALVAAKRGLERAPRHGPSRMALGIALAEKGDLHGALDAFAEARSSMSRYDLANLHHNIAVVHEKLGDDTAAERSYRDAIATIPWMAQYPRNLGHLLERTGREAEAIPLYRRALELAPEHADTRARLERLTLSR